MIINNPIQYHQEQMSLFDAQFRSRLRVLGIVLTVLLWSAANIGTFLLVFVINWVVVLGLLAIVNIVCWLLFQVAQIYVAHLLYNFHRDHLVHSPQVTAYHDDDPLIIDVQVTQDKRPLSV